MDNFAVTSKALSFPSFFRQISRFAVPPALKVPEKFRISAIVIRFSVGRETGIDFSKGMKLRAVTVTFISPEVFGLKVKLCGFVSFIVTTVYASASFIRQTVASSPAGRFVICTVMVFVPASICVGVTFTSNFWGTADHAGISGSPKRWRR